MKIFIDTANIQQIKEANALGIIDGVTTNPSLVAREAKDFNSLIHVLEAAKIGADVATVPYDTLMKLAGHPLTDIGVQKFLNDWKKVANV